MDVKITDNSQQVLSAFKQQLQNGLEAVGLTAEGYAKGDTPVNTGRLRNSISHKVDASTDSVVIGTNVEYAVYIELGTGIYASEGGGRQDPWFFEDEKGNWHITRGSKPHHMLKNAASEHTNEYKNLIESALKS